MPERVLVPIQLRWADTDQFRHINNVALVRYVEEARIRAFGLPYVPGSSTPDRPRPVLAVLGEDCFTITGGQRFEYRAEMPYLGQQIVAEVWVSRIGSRSFDMDCRLVDESGETEYLIASVALVLMDAVTRRPRALTTSEAYRLEHYLADGVAFR